MSLAQAANVERRLEGVISLDARTATGHGLSTVETCSTLPSSLVGDAVELRALRAGASAPTSFPAGSPVSLVAPERGAGPDYFLYAQRYRQVHPLSSTVSMNVFTRTSAQAPWLLCSWPNLYPGAALPRFAAVAPHVAPAPTAASVARARHAVAVLASYLTRRVANKVPTPPGLVTPLASCPKVAGPCTSGIQDPYFVHRSYMTRTASYVMGSDPLFAFTTADGGTLVIAELASTTRDTAVAGQWMNQDAKRSFWTEQVPPGHFSSVTVTGALQVVLLVDESGGARLAGANLLNLSAAEVPFR